MSVGVIVGRFQVDRPHAGHVELVEQVMKRHGKVLVLLGCAPTKLTQHDPLDYPTREKMLRDVFPNLVCAPIYDSPDDHEWSDQLDTIVGRMFPVDQPTLYGSRASFIPRYHGSIPVKELDTVNVMNGTDLRRHIAERVQSSPDFRAGVIYACYNRFPISYQVIDVAIVRKDEVLICRKAHDPFDKGGFIGGFVDPRDPTLESAVTREVAEETGLEIGPPEYLGSFRIDDWRYREREDKMLSALFLAPYVFGYAKAADDIVSCRWVPIRDLMKYIVDHHRAMADAVMARSTTT